MEEGFPFSKLNTSYLTTSWITWPQLPFQIPNRAPKTILPTILVTLFSYSGYRMGITNSKTLLSLGSIQLLTACPFLRFWTYHLCVCRFLTLMFFPPFGSYRLPPKVPLSIVLDPAGWYARIRWSAHAGTPAPLLCSSTSMVLPAVLRTPSS